MAALRLSSLGRTASPERPRLGLRRDLRLRRRADFDRVYERGRIYNDPLLVLRVLPNELGHNRYGFVVSKRVGGAVQRNRVRRRLQEIVRLRQGWGPSPRDGQGWGPSPKGEGLDIVLSCKAAAGEAKYQELEAAVGRLYAKGGLA